MLVLWLATIYRLLLLIKKTPDLDPKHYDARVCSLNLTSQNILEYCGAWQHCQDNLGVINHMRVWDDCGGGSIEFYAYELGIEHLAKVAINRDMQRSLWQVVQYSPLIDIKTDCQLSAIEQFSEHVSVLFEDQRSIEAKLLIAADGGSSWVRNYLGMVIKHKPYNHDAVVGIIETEKPHQATAIQNFLQQGPLGVLPSKEKNQCSFVWSTESDHASSVMAMDELCFNDTLAEAMQWYYGEVKLLSKLNVIPLHMRHARRYIDQRVVLVGDAAHTIHPLAGQGLNLGLFDVAYLTQSIRNGLINNYDIGSERILRQYERASRANNEVMLCGMKTFKEIFTQSNSTIVTGRSKALDFVNHTTLLKKIFIRYAIGERADLPEICYADVEG